MSTFSASKVELKQQYHDEWMIRWKRYQTREDFDIEVQSQNRRQWNYATTAGMFLVSGLYTAGPATINRVFGPPHFFDNGIDVPIKDSIKGTLNGFRRWTPNGFGRIAAIGIPSYLTLAVLEHWNQQARWNSYLGSNTAFGEQARRFEKTGKIEEFLCLNVKATLPKEDQAILADA